MACTIEIALKLKSDPWLTKMLSWNEEESL